MSYFQGQAKSQMNYNVLFSSSTLGTYCNSPSALFIASDGSSLRMYQAVIDARTLLIEMAPQRNKVHYNNTHSE